MGLKILVRRVPHFWPQSPKVGILIFRRQLTTRDGFKS